MVLPPVVGISRGDVCRTGVLDVRGSLGTGLVRPDGGRVEGVVDGGDADR